MRYPSRSLPHRFLMGIVLLECVALAACGDWCFSGVINNPNGVGVTAKNASPPAACPASPIISTMNVAVVKSQPCVDCTTAVRAEHIFITLTGVQFHSVSADSPDSPEWIDLAPQLRIHPREIDLLGDSAPLILVENAPIAAGAYRELRLQFASEISGNSHDALASETPCGQNRANCLLLANGRGDPLYFPGEPSELVMPLQINGSNSLAVVPGASLDLQLSLQPKQLSSVSPSLGWQIHFTLAGSASIAR
jgi:Domain of unknown function (DUF4382)